MFMMAVLVLFHTTQLPPGSFQLAQLTTLDAGPVKPGGGGGGTFFVLMENGTDFVLMEDLTSLVILEP